MRHDTSKLLYFVYVHGDDYGAGSAAANDDDDDDEKGIKKKKKWKIHCINPKGKFLLLPPEQRKIPWFEVSSERLSPEIDKLIRSPIPTLTEPAVA